MKTLFEFAAWKRRLAGAALAVGISFAISPADGGVLKEARVTQVIKDVKLLPGRAAPRAAAVSDDVRGDTAVRTGADSRAELTFTDLTIARLGANTIFSFNEGTRTISLTDGAILLRVPKDSGGAKIQTAAVTAAITGTTVMAEYHPKSYAKYIVLEGVMRLYLKGRLGESILMGPGQMMMVKPDATRLSEPVDVDLKRLIETSLFFQGFRPLGSEPLLADAQHVQLEKKAAGELIDTNLVIFGRGTLVTLTDPQSLDVIDRKIAATTLPVVVPIKPTPTPTATPTPSPSATPTPQPTPSKFGTPPVIVSSVPYVIDNSTQIQTDPAIAKGATTDFGKIYRDATQDGPFSTWAFTATSAFDTTSGIDAFYGPNVPVAAFKFAALQLSGNPTISIANGGALNLALISVGPINAVPAGNTTFTFTGMQSVLIATQNGSIDLSGISFQNIPLLFFYARGAGSNLVLGSPITGTRDLYLDAEGSVQVNGAETVTNFRSIAGVDFLTGTGPITAQSVFINAQRDINFSSQQFPVNTATRNTLSLGAGRNVNIDVTDVAPVFLNAATVNVTGAAINITSTSPNAFGIATLDVGNATATFTAGAGGIQAPNIILESLAHKITLRAQGDINVFAAIDPDLIQSSAGNINAGDVLQADTISAAGSITTGRRDMIGFNSITAGTTISAAGRLISPTISAGQSITTGADLISTGQVIAGTFIDVSGKIDANIVTAGTSIRTTGDFTAATSATAGTTINVGGTFRAPTAMAGGDISANRITLLNVTTPGVLRAGGGGITPFIPANPASLLHSFTVSSIVSAGGINFSGDNFVAEGDGKDGGKLSIFANTITFDAANITSANFNGASGVPTNSAGGSGGQFTITSTGAITVNAPIQATTGLNSANVAFGGTGGTVSLTSTAGAVNVNSSVQVSSADAAAGPARRRSASGGNINLQSGAATGVAINVTDTAQLLSLLDAAAPGPGGKITILATGANSSINVTGANVPGAPPPDSIRADRGSIDIRHTGAGGQITLTNSNIRADIVKVGALGNNGVLTIGGGTISADTTLKLYAAGSNGSVNFISNVTLSGNSVKTIAGNSVTVFNNVIVTIGGGKPADVYVLDRTKANYSGFNGGNGSTNGMFLLSGSNSPTSGAVTHLGVAPPDFGAPGGP
jgi:hypothetical protein